MKNFLALNGNRFELSKEFRKHIEERHWHYSASMTNIIPHTISMLFGSYDGLRTVTVLVSPWLPGKSQTLDLIRYSTTIIISGYNRPCTSNMLREDMTMDDMIETLEERLSRLLA